MVANALQGTVPQSFTTLSYLETIELCDNPNLIGAFPDPDVWMWSRLTRLYANACRPWSHAPPAHARGSSSPHRNLARNSFTTLPTAFGLAQSLQTVILDGNEWEGTLPATALPDSLVDLCVHACMHAAATVRVAPHRPPPLSAAASPRGVAPAPGCLRRPARRCLGGIAPVCPARSQAASRR